MVVREQVMKRLHKLRTTQLSATDDRVMQTNEAILGIRIVKMNCWEQPIEVNDTPTPTGHDAPCLGSRTTRTSWQKYFPPN